MAQDALLLRVGDLWVDMSMDGAEMVCDRYGTNLDDHRSASAKFCEDRCESPIEKKLLLAIWDVGFFKKSEASGKRWSDGTEITIAARSGQVLLLQQVKWGSYRLDFGVWDQDRGDRLSIAIECDGFDYHERTKEQARRDRSRDRELTTSGVEVLRFTGSEIHADPVACAKEIAYAFIRRCIRDEAASVAISETEALRRVEQYAETIK